MKAMIHRWYMQNVYEIFALVTRQGLEISGTGLCLMESWTITSRGNGNRTWSRENKKHNHCLLLIIITSGHLPEQGWLQWIQPALSFACAMHPATLNPVLLMMSSTLQNCCCLFAFFFPLIFLSSTVFMTILGLLIQRLLRAGVICSRGSEDAEAQRHVSFEQIIAVIFSPWMEITTRQGVFRLQHLRDRGDP